MNPKSLLAALLAGAVVAGAVLAPPSSNGQAARPAAAPAVVAEDPALTALLTDVVAQQAMIAENQAQIDTKLATVSETLRLARIYVGRGGGKTP
jgi:hypothetical protein